MAYVLSLKHDGSLQFNIKNNIMKKPTSFKLVLVFLVLITTILRGKLIAQVSYGYAFTHETDRSNTISSISRSTALDNPLTNFQEEKVLFVTQNISNGGHPNDHPIGVKYNYGQGKWNILNLDTGLLPLGVKFNVLALPRTNPNVYVHQNRNRGQVQIFTGSYDTRLRHPKLDNNPTATFIVSQQVVALQRSNSNRLVFNPNEVSVYYKNGYWYIYNKNHKIMPEGCIFNIYINEAINTSEGINRGKSHIINNANSNLQPDKLLFTTSKNKTPVREVHKTNALFYQKYTIRGRTDGKKWHIINLSGEPMDSTQKFNVLAYEPLSETPRYSVHIFDRNGTRREYLNNALFMVDPSKTDIGTFVGIDKIDYNDSNRLVINQVNSGATDYGYLHHGNTSISKFIQGPSGRHIGLFTLSQNKIVTTRIDSNADGIIDHMKIVDGVNNRVTFFTLETERNIRELEEMLNGRNIICQMNTSQQSSISGQQNNFGFNVNENAIINGCNANGVSEGAGIPNVDLNNQVMGWIDLQCASVLTSTQGSSGSIVSDPPQGTREWLSSVGKTIAATGAAVGAAIVATGPAAPVTAVVGASIVLAGTAMVVAGEILSWLEEPLPGEEGQFSWNDFCERRASNHGTVMSMDNLQEMLSHQDCENPLENITGLIRTGIVMSGGSPRPRPTPGPFPPYRPNTIENSLFCQNQEGHDRFGSIWNIIVEEQCNNPTAQPGPDDMRCGTRTTLTPGGQLEIGAADILAPRFAKEVKEMLEKVINPGFMPR